MRGSVIRALLRYGFGVSCLATFAFAAFGPPLWAVAAMIVASLLGWWGLFDEVNQETPKLDPRTVTRLTDRPARTTDRGWREAE